MYFDCDTLGCIRFNHYYHNNIIMKSTIWTKVPYSTSVELCPKLNNYGKRELIWQLNQGSPNHTVHILFQTIVLHIQWSLNKNIFPQKWIQCKLFGELSSDGIGISQCLLLLWKLHLPVVYGLIYSQLLMVRYWFHTQQDHDTGKENEDWNKHPCCSIHSARDAFMAHRMYDGLI